MIFNLHKGDKVKFKSERQRYTVQAVSRNFAICTKPFNARKTYFYTIIDIAEGMRGPENLIFHCSDLETKKGCREMMIRLRRGTSELSYRRSIPLDIEEIILTNPDNKKSDD